METEIWKDIPWYENKYQASDNWKIRKLTRLHRYIKKWFRYKEMSIKVDWVWYFRINLSKKWIAKTFRVHRLVALAFIPLVDWKD